MPESRDRIARPIDLAAVYARRRAGILSVLSDEDTHLLGSPLRRLATPTRVDRPRRSGLIRRGSVGNRSLLRRGQNLYRPLVIGGENSPFGSALRGRGRNGNSILPSWYPRSPLRDIAAVVREIERRRTALRDLDSQLVPDPVSVNETLDDPTGAAIKHPNGFTPKTLLKIKLSDSAVEKVSRILDGVANRSEKEQDSLTPQKKLLDCIDTLEKVVNEELQKMKRTPDAKKSERDKRVRTLMSMR